ncbi:polysaccharide deacetylase family protein [Maridesulfovibrio hydrothermalis]|uniref:Polysaccharide deacetylase n=1 Tax=Maridesulfovibrio hydrothermalis AM13 = DSM 14728 TaxID=1121451 RepID=L0RER4_9BACT|nr:polysaccharide deacetylase family protein [Maridesulfovibrio hydrothermalis]CCO24702.1 Polysaccharide deacetylase [Maridesulfovibrio hydrothermalis AM13 = DSM 14728]
MSYRPVSSIWKNNISTLIESFDKWWNNLEKIIPESGCDVFFRADDIGYPGRQFSEMIEVFKSNETPLSLAVVPAWINEKRTKSLIDTLGPDLQLWCLHQHGYRHINCEKKGKKYEFGPSRDKEKIAAELTRGQQKLSRLLGKNFCPFFTPPWNRCTSEAMSCLADLGFIAISRSINVSPCPLDNLPDLPINIDLHTIKEKNPASGIAILKTQIENAVKNDYAGFMLHHQRMNKTSLLFLDFLLKKIRSTPGFRINDIREMLS